MGISKDAIGIGLRIPHYNYIFQHWPQVDFFEITSENFMVQGGPPLENLEKILSRYLVVLHGVSLGLGSSSEWNQDYINRLKNLARKTNTPYFTDHLCWTRSQGIELHDLLPLPYTNSMIDYVAERAKRIQDFIGIPFGIENLSSYVEYHQSEMTEYEFYNSVVEKSGCYHLLDINNIYVSSVNHGFDARDYLASIQWDKVLQVHLAGHSENTDGTLLDTHDAPVKPEVWDLYCEAWRLSGGFPTLLERDAKIPPFEELHSEALKGKSLRDGNIKLAPANTTERHGR